MAKPPVTGAVEPGASRAGEGGTRLEEDYWAWHCPVIGSYYLLRLSVNCFASTNCLQE